MKRLVLLVFVLWPTLAFAQGINNPCGNVATSTVPGCVKPDGTTITNSAGAISTTYGTTVGTATQGNDARLPSSIPVPASQGGAGAINGILQGNGSGVVSQAVAGTNYGQSKIVGFTVDVSTTGSQAVTGVGFVPTRCFFNAANNGAVTINLISIGFSDSGKSGASIGGYTDVGDAFGAAPVPFLMTNSGGTTQAQFIIASYDADGFTITKAKTGSPTGTWTVKALCER